ncbi:hypothetical protein [Actinoplanes campanulatus]|nr:hypothetical protein [Actinoplanes capillaceus]
MIMNVLALAAYLIGGVWALLTDTPIVMRGPSSLAHPAYGAG